MPYPLRHQFRPAAHPEAAVQFADVLVHRVLAEVKVARDLLFALAAEHAL
jgi:hypothetical protein